MCGGGVLCCCCIDRSRVRWSGPVPRNIVPRFFALSLLLLARSTSNEISTSKSSLAACFFSNQSINNNEINE